MRGLLGDYAEVEKENLHCLPCSGSWKRGDKSEKRGCFWPDLFWALDSFVIFSNSMFFPVLSLTASVTFPWPQNKVKTTAREEQVFSKQQQCSSGHWWFGSRYSMANDQQCTSAEKWEGEDCGKLLWTRSGTNKQYCHCFKKKQYDIECVVFKN